MSSIIIAMAVFLGVAGLVGGVAVMLFDKPGAKMEDRLKAVTSGKTSDEKKKPGKKNSGILTSPIDEGPSWLKNILGRFEKFELWFEQADSSLTMTRFVVICLILGGAGFFLGVVGTPSKPYLWLVSAAILGLLPFAWLNFRSSRRLKKFTDQLPDAMDMLGRSLRSGHSLSAGFSLVAKEMADPISMEFSRVFEEQNLGIPLEDSLEGLTSRVPSLDLKFFCTAVILQRTTGGDLAEILDKIGHLIRERFAILGQVQALTGEGRISGVVLLGLPILLFGVVYYLNPSYIMLLFEEPLGKKMLVGAIVLQVVGALVIRKIVNIKV